MNDSNTLSMPIQDPAVTTAPSAQGGYTVHVGVTQRGLEGFAKQNLTCGQATSELVDNAIAAADGGKARVQVLLNEEPDSPYIRLTVVDWGSGMDLPRLANALQIGSTPVGNNRINEHGFGLHNALSSFTGGKLGWRLATACMAGGPWLVTDGPFRVEMAVREETDLAHVFPHLSFAFPDPSTVISILVPRAYLQAMLSKRNANGDLAALRDMFVEYLGITYRGYLDVDRRTLDPSASILFTVAGQTTLVPAIPVPITGEKVYRFEVGIGGQMTACEFHYGMLDTDKRDHLILTEDGTRPVRYYYQGNMRTQGVDIRVGKRVIATAQLGEIWYSNKGDPLARHPSYNEFCGEVIIPELPRGLLSTCNNKSSIDYSDTNWQNLFAHLREVEPLKNPTACTEKELREKWVKILRAARPEDTVSDECSVWPTGTRVDVVDSGEGNLDLYELKVGKAEPQHLYQLKMYWDGMVLDGRQPTSGTLLVLKSSGDIQAMLEQMNRMPPPLLPDGTPSKPYRFQVATHAQKCLETRRLK